MKALPLLVATTLALLTSGLGGPLEGQDLDQREGYVEGRASVVILPATGPLVPAWGDQYPEEFGNPAGFEVHMVPENDQNMEYLY